MKPTSRHSWIWIVLRAVEPWVHLRQKLAQQLAKSQDELAMARKLKIIEWVEQLVLWKVCDLKCCDGSAWSCRARRSCQFAHVAWNISSGKKSIKTMCFFFIAPKNTNPLRTRMFAKKSNRNIYIYIHKYRYNWLYLYMYLNKIHVYIDLDA